MSSKAYYNVITNRLRSGTGTYMKLAGEWVTFSPAGVQLSWQFIFLSTQLVMCLVTVSHTTHQLRLVWLQLSDHCQPVCYLVTENNNKLEREATITPAGLHSTVMDLTKIPGANDQHLIHVQWHSDALAVSVCCTLAETNPTNSCKSTVNLRLWVIFHRETETETQLSKLIENRQNEGRNCIWLSSSMSD